MPAATGELIGDADIADAQGADPRLGPDGRRSSSRPRGRRPRRSAAATSAAARTAPASASSRSAAGRSTTPTSWRPCCARSRASRRRSTSRGGKQVSLADLIVLGGCAGGRAGRRRRPAIESTVPFTPGPHRRLAGADRRRVVRRARADGRRVPQLPRQGPPAAGRVPADRPGEPAHAQRARDDRARRRPAGPRRELRAAPRSACSPTTPGTLTNDFFVNLLDMGTDVDADRRRTEPSRRATPPARSSGRAAGSTSCSARTPSCGRSPRSTPATTPRHKFVHDFVAAWDKVMNLDRYDLRTPAACTRERVHAAEVGVSDRRRVGKT